MKVDLSRYQYGYDLVIRGGKLYDRKTHTFSFEGVTVKCTVVWLFEFEELPESLRQYITIRAARQFSDGDLQSQIINGLTEDDEIKARINWESDDIRQGDLNMLKDSASTAQFLDREAG